MTQGAILTILLRNRMFLYFATGLVDISLPNCTYEPYVRGAANDSI